MENITVDQLIRIVETIVFLGPINKEELKAHLRTIVKQTPDDNTLESILSALKEKYSVNLFGIEFAEQQGQFQFKCRKIKDILNA